MAYRLILVMLTVSVITADLYAQALAIDERTGLAGSPDPADRLLFCAHAYALAWARLGQPVRDRKPPQLS